MKKFYSAKSAIPCFEELYSKKTLSQFKRYNKLISQFKKTYGKNFCHLASASGRVELIGNHTDHNGGKVIGCAIDLDIVAAFLPNDENIIRINSERSKPIVFSVKDAGRIEGGSVGLVKGVVRYLCECGYTVGGFDAYLNSDIPSGMGISSSAAFEEVAAAIINHCYNCGSIPTEVSAKAGQFAENVYFGKSCGLLDQSVVAFGGAVFLDFCQGIKSSKINANFNALSLILINTGKSHSNLSDLYAEIPSEMKRVAEYFKKQRLIEIDEELFWENYENVVRTVGERPALRAKHFFEENGRVDETLKTLSSASWNDFIKLVNESGDSSINNLQNCAVDDSDKAIIDAVSFARTAEPKCGVRVHGGGFAGTVLCVSEKRYSERLIKSLISRYGKKNVLQLRIRNVGAKVL